MEAGTESALRSMSPLRVAQAIAALGGSGGPLSTNDQTIGTDYTLAVGENASAVGPIAVADDVTLTISDDSYFFVIDDGTELPAEISIASEIHAATNKSTPVDSDEVGIWDSVTGMLNHVTWANIKATLKTYFDTLYIYTPPSSMVRLNTHNGYGSTNTKIRRFTNVVTNTGSDITYADSAANGAIFTINTDGIYSISYSDSFNASSTFGISLNSSQLTTAVQSITIGDVLAASMTPAANTPGTVSVTLLLSAGDVIRAHTDGAAAGLGRQFFTITRVA
jgi:hypothetical protein